MVTIPVVLSLDRLGKELWKISIAFAMPPFLDKGDRTIMRHLSATAIEPAPSTAQEVLDAAAVLVRGGSGEDSVCAVSSGCQFNYSLTLTPMLLSSSPSSGTWRDIDVLQPQLAHHDAPVGASSTRECNPRPPR